MRVKLLRGCAIGAVISALIALPVTPIASLALIGTFFVTGLVHISHSASPSPPHTVGGFMRGGMP